MTEDKCATRIALVNYINAKPFGFGLSSYADTNFEVLMANPAECAKLYEQGSVDIALIPVGALHYIQDYQVITDFCIGCNGAVKTVCIFSDQELKNCHTIYLDDHSRTSALLCKLIIGEYFKMQPNYAPASVENLVLESGAAKLMIGDKVFENEHDYKFKYDLGSIWLEWKNLPFAFAVWIARKNTNVEIIKHLNLALAEGIDHVAELSQEDDELALYFSKHISYVLNEGKRRSMQIYLDESLKYL
jgi:chorismate dehydratase